MARILFASDSAAPGESNAGWAGALSPRCLVHRVGEGRDRQGTPEDFSCARHWAHSLRSPFILPVTPGQRMGAQGERCRAGGFIQGPDWGQAEVTVSGRVLACFELLGRKMPPRPLSLLGLSHVRCAGCPRSSQALSSSFGSRHCFTRDSELPNNRAPTLIGFSHVAPFRGGIWACCQAGTWPRTQAVVSESPFPEKPESAVPGVQPCRDLPLALGPPEPGSGKVTVETTRWYYVHPPVTSHTCSSDSPAFGSFPWTSC